MVHVSYSEEDWQGGREVVDDNRIDDVVAITSGEELKERERDSLLMIILLSTELYVLAC